MRRSSRRRVNSYNGDQLNYRGSSTTRLSVFLQIARSPQWKGATVCYEERTEGFNTQVGYNVLKLGTAVLRVRL